MNKGIQLWYKKCMQLLTKWRHFLIGRCFILLIAQKSLLIMFNINYSGKIKNDKIMRWQLKLSCYIYNIVYCNSKKQVWFTELTLKLYLTLLKTRGRWYQTVQYVLNLNHRFIQQMTKKAAITFKRLNMDFKGSLLSKSQNTYLLIINDE